MYPCVEEAEKERSAWKKNVVDDAQPDFIGLAPNYDKFPGWNPEEVMAFLNVD